jgi:ubiquinone/menaquinone biosynthesis C-methylase UbiE
MVAWANIEAIDLYSAHPKIKVQTMDDTGYPEKTFDVIIMANTFSYSADPNQTISEMARILKKNGRFIFNATYDPKNPDYPCDRIPVKKVLGILKAAGLRAAYHMAFNKTNAKGRPQTTHTLGVVRSDSESHLLDSLENQLD